jgi:hypothetical protein
MDWSPDVLEIVLWKSLELIERLKSESFLTLGQCRCSLFYASNAASLPHSLI